MFARFVDKALFSTIQSRAAEQWGCVLRQYRLCTNFRVLSQRGGLGQALDVTSQCSQELQKPQVLMLLPAAEAQFARSCALGGGQ